MKLKRLCALIPFMALLGCGKSEDSRTKDLVIVEKPGWIRISYVKEVTSKIQLAFAGSGFRPCFGFGTDGIVSGVPVFWLTTNFCSSDSVISAGSWVGIGSQKSISGGSVAYEINGRVVARGSSTDYLDVLCNDAETAVNCQLTVRPGGQLTLEVKPNFIMVP